MSDTSDKDIVKHLHEYEKYEKELKFNIPEEKNGVMRGWLEARLKSVERRIDELTKEID